jgi:hypothetical protein
VIAIGIPKLLVVVLSGKSEFESASIEAGGEGGIAADLVEQGTKLERVDLVGVLTLKAIARLGGFVEATRVDQVDGVVGEAIELVHLVGELGDDRAESVFAAPESAAPEPGVDLGRVEDEGGLALGGRASAFDRGGFVGGQTAALVLLAAAAPARVIAPDLGRLHLSVLPRADPMR